MQQCSFTMNVMRTTAIALPLLGAPFTVKMVDQGPQVVPAQAWAESDRGDGGDHGSGGDHGGSSGGSDHSSGGDHSSSDHSSGGSDHSGSSTGSDDHSSSSGHDDHSSSSDGSHNGSQDQSKDQSQSHDQDRLAQDRDSWLGVSGQSSSAQTGSGGALTPVPQNEERQLIERGWAGDDAQGSHQ